MNMPTSEKEKGQESLRRPFQYFFGTDIDEKRSMPTLQSDRGTEYAKRYCYVLPPSSLASEITFYASNIGTLVTTAARRTVPKSQC